VSLSAADSLEIVQLVTRADNCATARDADGYARLSTEDGVMTGAMGSASGRAGLREAVTAVWAAEPPRTLHLTLNVTIDESRADPTVTSIMLTITREETRRVLGSAFIRQVVRRTPEGWRIVSRDIRL
jgi:uncharacterized protein (TIGR02246 family)